MGCCIYIVTSRIHFSDPSSKPDHPLAVVIIDCLMISQANAKAPGFLVTDWKSMSATTHLTCISSSTEDFLQADTKTCSN